MSCRCCHCDVPAPRERYYEIQGGNEWHAFTSLEGAIAAARITEIPKGGHLYVIGVTTGTRYWTSPWVSA